MAVILQRLDLNFRSPIYSDEVGKRFEQACRRVLSSEGFGVFPGRLNLPFQYIPSGAARQVGQRIKTSTDIDVIARKGDFLLVVECKERTRPRRGSLYLQNLLAKMSVDLQYKTLWIRANTQEASKLLGKEWGRLLVNESDIWYVPLLVSNFPVDLPADLKSVVLSLSELERLAGVIELGRIVKSGKDHFLSMKGIVRTSSCDTRIFPSSSIIEVGE
jgi:hypothetical protein